MARMGRPNCEADENGYFLGPCMYKLPLITYAYVGGGGGGGVLFFYEVVGLAAKLTP